MSRSFLRPAVVVLAGALLAAGCSAGSTASPGGGAGTGPDAPLRIGLTAEPANLDFTRTDGAAIPEALLVNVYEGLVALDQQTGEIVPALAESWTVSPDGLVYDFTLREGVTFSNGEPFTADDVKFSIERVQSDEWTISLKDGMSVVSGVEVVSPTQARVTLAQPSNSWLFRMTTRIGAMFDPSGVGDLANTAVGTGPYAVAEFRRGDALVLARRADYWGEAPAIGQVVLQYFDDATAATNALLTDGIDVIGTVQAPESLAQFEGDDRFQVIEGTTNGEVTLAMNNAAGPTSDPRVRRAIAMAIDHEAVLSTAWAGRGTLIDTMVPPTDPWYQPLPDVTPFDPDAARALLAEAGTPNPTLRFRIANLPYAVASAQVVQSQLAAVGIDAQIEPLEFPARWLEEVLTNADYDLSIVAHVEPRDIRTFGNPQYYWRYDNAEVQRLLAESEQGTQEQQVSALQEVGRRIAEDAAADWLFLLPNLIVADVDVQGLPENRIGEALDLTALSRG
ncbi:ABC transporter substrate-binding protein [Pseudonocardia kunmingensis]|uniref:Peptide/nickel transport system substrate-binding protein n=1 Tax=Pseudonocardia kunmingensis TaxID=630975 RepID=A0A543D4S7_9PSEU|nr:ABC transporter substrate-binding protein [Pseudonocardia kunmingensis]TQM04341.1 peptide/nickel transport system substrate-binding protein [Pseudonocardia kunmingensis]